MANTVAMCGDGASGDIIKIKPPTSLEDMPDDVLIEIIDTILLAHHSDLLKSRLPSVLASINRRWQIITETTYLRRKSSLQIQPVDIPNFAHFFRYHWRANHLSCILFKIDIVNKPAALQHTPQMNLVKSRLFLAKEVETAFHKLFSVLKTWNLSHKGLSLKYIIHFRDFSGSCLFDDWDVVGLGCDFSKLPKLPLIRHLEQLSSERHLGTTSSSYLSLLSRLPAVQLLTVCCSIPERLPVDYTRISTEHEDKFCSIPITTPHITSLQLHAIYFQCQYSWNDCMPQYGRIRPTLDSSAARPLLESLLYLGNQLERLDLKITRMSDPTLFFTVSIERTRSQGSPAWPKLRHLVVDGPYLTYDQGNVMKMLCEKDNIRQVFPLLSKLRVSITCWDMNTIYENVRLADVTINLDM
ncbi:hypothetical protein VPNG_09643 [Cytospora leucostoma]|uniref:F-box domain-containing protein n=1 Tax=Cytospora leucostoma TaxID=1230097 RepID=A0A423VMI5_9PEZI|nr:hypothetical protein VPNG_09643 [Cytospora leucostoma]